MTITKNDKKEIIRRSQLADSGQVQIKETEGIIDGYPIVFNEQTFIGDYFIEEIAPTALDEADLTDIKFLVNHDDKLIPLARHRRGKRSTMDISIDERGLKITAKLDRENNSTARALFSAVERGDIEDMSFAFGIEVAGDEWSDLDKDIPKRRITKISKVFEISAVNDGAYSQTCISARSVALDNDKQTLQSVLTEALDNEKKAEDIKRATALQLAKRKIILKERYNLT